MISQFNYWHVVCINHGCNMLQAPRLWLKTGFWNGGKMSENEKREIEIIESETNNYFVYPGQCQPQRAYIYICPEEDEMYSDYDRYIGSGMSSHVWHRRKLRFSICHTMTTWSINQLMESIKDAAQTICDGYSCEWDGNNHVGVYTEKAQDLIDKLESMFENYDYDYDSIVVYDNFEEYLDGLDLKEELKGHHNFSSIIEHAEISGDPEVIVNFDEDDIIKYIVEAIEEENLEPSEVPKWCIDASEEIRTAIEEILTEE